MLDPDAAAVLAAAGRAQAPSYDQLGPVQARAVYDAGRRASTAPPVEIAEIRDILIPGDDAPLSCRLYRPASAVELPLLVFFHGGGWVLGNLASHDGLCRRLAHEAGVAVLAVDYRLAPEHPFPAAFDDAVHAFAWAEANAADLGIDPLRMAVGGDSAGGNLAAALCLARRATGQTLPAAQLLIYPALDFAMDTPSHRDFAQGYMLTATLLAWFRDCYLPPGIARDDWRVSPLRATDLGGLPPAIILTAGYDPLRDEGEAWGQRLVAAGVITTMLRIPGQIHGFLPMDALMQAAIPATETLAHQLRSILGRAPS